MSYWTGKSVLVTGAGGFIGSHLAERLAAEGARVRAFVRYSSTGDRGWFETDAAAESIAFHYGDICDADSVMTAARDVEVIFHLAALIAIPYSYEAPRAYVRTNIEGTLNVLQAARALGDVRLVCTSTSEVYGSALRAPIDEDHPLQGQSPYSASKIGADKIAESFHRSFNTPVVICRPFNTFGPRQSTRAVIPSIITQLLKGPDVQLGALTPTRDLNYVSNTVDGFLACGEHDSALGGVFNFGSNREISIFDLAHLIAELMGVRINLRGVDERLRPEKSEVTRLLADNRLAAETFGWSPAVSLEEGLGLTITWLTKNLSRYRVGEYVK